MEIYTTILLIGLVFITILTFTKDRYHYTGYYTPEMYDKHCDEWMIPDRCMGWHVLMQAIADKGQEEFWSGLNWNCHTGILTDMKGNQYLVESYHRGEPFSFISQPRPSHNLKIDFKVSYEPTIKNLEGCLN